MGYKLTFAYDTRGNLTDVTDQDNATTHYDYDADSRMTAVTNPFSETTGYEYSPGGRVETRLLGNGCVTYYGYDEAGQVSLVDNRAPDLSVISSFAYERDSRGNPTRITREDGSVVEYGYDAKSQLTSEVHRDPLGATTDAWEWDYDLCGNRTYQIFNGVRTDYTYNLANQLLTETTAGVTTYYAYDRCGNTKSKQGPEGTTGYHWDHENRLTQIDQPGSVHSYFSYDADGKRVTKDDAEGFTRFIYQGPDMLALLQERDENGDLLAHYTMGDGLESMRRGTDSRFYHYDWLGSTFNLTDDTGAVTDSYLYDAWGSALATTGATPNPHRYVGRLRYYEMPGTGLCQLGHRELNPTSGRFATLDPRRQGASWYAYVIAAPTRYVDPYGLQLDPSLSPGAWVGPIEIPIKSEIDWLNAHPTPKGSPERIAKIESLVYHIITAGSLTYPLASESLARWMSGKGDHSIDFTRLLKSPDFAAAYDRLTEKLLRKCCSTSSAEGRVLSDKNVRFKEGELYYTFNLWDHFLGKARFTKTGRQCWIPGIRQEGQEARAELTFEFADRYDWTPGDATPFRIFRRRIDLGEVPHDWLLEYLTYALSHHRRNWFGGPPRNFVTRAYQSDSAYLCCINGQGYRIFQTANERRQGR